MRSFLSHLARALLFPLALVPFGACGGSTGAVLSKTDGGDPSPRFPPGSDCTNGPNFTGCTCTPGESRACYTGPANTRSVGPCKDGVQTCETKEVSTYAFGACTGEIIPGGSISCPAADAGVPDAPSGEEAGANCGGIAGLVCPSDQYCGQFPPNDVCGGGDSFGKCTPKPGGCTADCPGVCGCDNKTYCNECGANAAGVALRHLGACP
jgi:hypothetical protein